MRLALLAEDDPTTRRLLSTVLKHLGYTVIETADGREALAEFEARAPDLVLTDISMPHMDGIELASRIRKVNPDLPIVVLTGMADRESARRAKEIGVNGYLQKPVKLAELKKSINSLMTAA